MKRIDSHPRLAREGWFYCGLTFIAALATTLTFSFWVAIWFWVIVLFVWQFFRDPHRDIPDEDGALVSPADGKVIFTGS